ncbi:type VI-B CRISPR-associated RNA-guided ribonuclease Cas13b [Chryseobacterium joostei]|uniref:type VI-B CRISPR-associated RNA-guided ribonuclease Cas13b n=1 Tax=Chryseobacterium joostei TaxID=112234 RepID=UPI003D0C83A1
METQILGNGISYDHTKITDKHFFGGFLNTAKNNIDLLVKAYISKFEPTIESLNSVQFPDVCFKKKDSDTDFQHKFQFVRKHLPVIQYITYNGDREVLKHKFKLLLQAIDSLRNFYTHYYHNPLQFPDELLTLLDAIFGKVGEDVRQNKMKDDKTRHLLKKNLSEELDFRYQEQLEKLRKLKREGKNVNLNDTAAIKNGVLNAAFNHLIFKDDQDFKPTVSYSAHYYGADSAENKISISQSGLLFLLSMFLGRKEMEDLKSRVRGFKARIIRSEEQNVSGLKFMATHWLFSELCFKRIKPRLNADYHEETLLIQVIDELTKVPDELYRSFDKATKERFIEDINEYIREGKVDKSLIESKIVHPVIRKRYESKFNYFAIRFLDEFMNFPTLRFQVHVGNYVHDRRVKNIEGTGFQTERLVKDRIKVFGKISTISRLKAECLAKAAEIITDTGWELLPNPSYVFIENNIPIHLIVDASFKNGVKEYQKKRRAEKPEEMKNREGGNKMHKPAISNMIGSKKEINPESPVALLSMNEIPALLYEILIKKVSPAEIEEKIRQKLTTGFERIRDYDPESPLPASQISKRLRNNTGVKTVNTQKLVALIKKEVEQTEKKLALIAKNRRECREKVMGKFKRPKVFKNSELGVEAAWLADDIKRFMPAEQKKNWKGYQHSQLQQSLAFFERRPTEARSLLQVGWDFSDGSSCWNGWVMNSFARDKSFDGFYESYLYGRKKYFSRLEDHIVQHSSNTKHLRKFMEQQMPKGLFENRLYILEDLATEKNKLLSKPLIFPRGIFDDKPTFRKGVQVTENPNGFADWYRYGYDTTHKFQQFYSWERNYEELLQEELGKDTSFSKNSPYYSKESQLELLSKKQELKIKKVRIQDLYLKLMAEFLFEKVFGHPVALSLDEFHLTQEERLKLEQEAATQSQRVKGDGSPNIVREDFIWSKTIPFAIGKISEPNVKLKDIGKFRAFLTDDKVITLLSYDNIEKCNKLEIENELIIGAESYEFIRRERLFSEIQQMEREILEKWPWDDEIHPPEFEVSDNKGERHPNFKRYMVNGVLRKIKDVDENEVLWLEGSTENAFENLSKNELAEKSELVQLAFLVVVIRNQFAHNHLPAKQFYEFIKDKYPDVQGETVSAFYLEFVRFAIPKLMGF